MPTQAMRGVFPILITPFTEDGQIDENSLRRLIEFNLKAGVHGLGVALASEVFKLSERERDEVTAIVVSQTDGCVPVVINTGAPGTDLAILYSRRAQDQGADALMILPPSFMPATDGEVLAYYQTISAAVNIPIFLQDTPAATIGPHLARQIAETCEWVRYIKVESMPITAKVSTMKTEAGDLLTIFGGAGGGYFIEELRRGSVGTMPFCSQPEAFVEIWNLYAAGDERAAMEIFNHVLVPIAHMEQPVFDIKKKVKPTFFPKHQEAIYRRLENKHTSVEILAKKDDDPLNTEMVLNLGPQHPATHGVLRCVLQLNGELIEKCVLDVGYLHRGIEKIAEHKTYQEFMPYTDRMDYLSPYSSNVGFCLAVEKAAGIEVPPRAQWLRTLACEVARLSAHLLWLGTMVMDAGAISMFMWTFREREFLYDIFDKFAGVRFTVSHSRIGGLQFDVDQSVLDHIGSWLKNFKKELKNWRKMLAKNAIFLRRVDGVGHISKEDAMDLGLTGPSLRASGIAHDIRTFEPYLVYDQLDFDVVIREEGDCYARYLVRHDEMLQSIKMIEQMLGQIPKGDIRADDAKQTYPSKDEVYYSMEGLIHDFMMTDVGVCPPKGIEVYSAIEAPKGELGFHLMSDGTGSPWRCKINSPSYTNLQGLEKIMEGAMIADTVVLIGSMDPVMGEADK